MWFPIRASRSAFPGYVIALFAAAAAARVAAGEPGTRGADSAAPPRGLALVVLAVTLNREIHRDPVIALRDAAGGAFVAAGDLARWRLRLPDSAPTVFQSERYFPLTAFPGLVATIGERDQTLAIEAPPALFISTQIDAGVAAGPVPRRTASGGFLNYSLLATRTGSATTAAGSFELGAFGPWGVLTNTALGSAGEGKPGLTRLESSWSYAMPGRLAALRAGDTVSRGGTWGNAVRFGGLQYATDFATQPNLVLAPGQNIAGQTGVATTVDVFINNALVAQQAVRPGPFSITNIPPVTGTGSISLIIRDELGRDQVITRPFYASPTLLRPGLADFSFDAGFLRRKFGVVSDDYGPWLASATYRRGLDDHFTGEARAEAQAGLANAGIGADVLVGDLGVLSASAAAGRNPLGSGARASLGFERQSRGLSFTVRGAWASPRFRQIGDSDSPATVSHELLASAGYGFDHFGTIALAYVTRSYREQPTTTIASLGYSLNLERWGYLGVSLSRVRTEGRSTSINAVWTVPFGASTSASLGIDRVRGGGAADYDERSLSLQRNLPPGEGWGYRLRGSDHGARQAEVDYQYRYGSYSVEVAQVRGVSGERISVSGGVGAIGDTLFLSRAIDDSFGLVRLRGYPDVRVYSENQEIGRTDASGALIVPRLLPYQRNSVRIEQSDLPFDAEFEVLTHDAIPFARSGVLLDFAVRPARGAVVTIVQQNGEVVPAGASVRIDGLDRSFPVALGGDAYLSGLPARSRAVVSWREDQCSFEFDYPDGGDPQPHLGPLVCRRAH